MSNPDSFINEVTEEVRRDRLYGYAKRYGWIPVLAVLVIVGSAAWREYSAAQREAAAQEFGSAVLAALEPEEPEARIAALEELQAPGADAQAVLAMLIASEQATAEQSGAAAQTLQGVAAETDIYRQIASFRALAAEGVSPEEKRIGFEALVTPGNPLRLLAEEQLALLDIAAGETDAALDRLLAIRADSEVTQGLRRRAGQLIVALGGELQAS